MIKTVTVVNHLNEKLVLDLMRPEKSGFVVKKIDGLGPVKANIHTVEVSTRDGSQFNSARSTQRNIVIYLKYLFQNSIEDVRQKSYRYFPVKKPMRLVIETDNRVLEIDGYVESNDPDIFSNMSSAQISIICPNPHFRSVDSNGSNTVLFHGVEALFEFPFSNESISEPKIEFGSLKNRTMQNIPYSGDVDNGFTMVIRAIGEAEHVTIHNARTRESMTIDTDKLAKITGSKIVTGDEITICTVEGSKSITLMRDGEYINILNCLSRDTDWFQLVKGDNIFAYVAESGSENLQFMVKYNALYEGV